MIWYIYIQYIYNWTKRNQNIRYIRLSCSQIAIHFSMGIFCSLNMSAEVKLFCRKAEVWKKKNLFDGVKRFRRGRFCEKVAVFFVRSNRQKWHFCWKGLGYWTLTGRSLWLDDGWWRQTEELWFSKEKSLRVLRCISGNFVEVEVSTKRWFINQGPPKMALKAHYPPLGILAHRNWEWWLYTPIIIRRGDWIPRAHLI